MLPNKNCYELDFIKNKISDKLAVGINISNYRNK